MLIHCCIVWNKNKTKNMLPSRIVILDYDEDARETACLMLRDFTAGPTWRKHHVVLGMEGKD